MRLLLLLLLVPMVAAADAPKQKLPFTIKSEREPVAKVLEVETPLGIVHANLYTIFQSVGESGLLDMSDFELPAKHQKSKPEAIYETVLKKVMKIEKNVAIKIGKDVGREVVYAERTVDPQTGKSLTRERWVVHNGRLHIVRAMWSEKREGAAAWVKKVGDPFVESLAFP